MWEGVGVPEGGELLKGTTALGHPPHPTHSPTQAGHQRKGERREEYFFVFT